MQAKYLFRVNSSIISIEKYLHQQTKGVPKMSNPKIFSFVILLFLFLVLIASCQQEQAPMSEPVKDGVFIHISNGTNDPHRVLMALNMAAIMAEDKDVLPFGGVHLICKIHGIRYWYCSI